MPVVQNISKVLRDPNRRQVKKEYVFCFLHPIYTPYLGYQTIINADKELEEKHRAFKVRLKQLINGFVITLIPHHIIMYSIKMKLVAGYG